MTYINDIDNNSADSSILCIGKFIIWGAIIVGIVGALGMILEILPLKLAVVMTVFPPFISFVYSIFCAKYINFEEQLFNNKKTYIKYKSVNDNEDTRPNYKKIGLFPAYMHYFLTVAFFFYIGLTRLNLIAGLSYAVMFSVVFFVFLLVLIFSNKEISKANGTRKSILLMCAVMIVIPMGISTLYLTTSDYDTDKATILYLNKRTSSRSAITYDCAMELSDGTRINLDITREQYYKLENRKNVNLNIYEGAFDSRFAFLNL
ncbi:MAG: hypothetical protein K6F66_07575 [Pseudobutyrivibrio sp.]|nr:hypothetical protein [Pseudobutyrivibrio sp.]